MDIHLDGGEISIIKALGFSGTGLPGEALMARVGNLGEAEFLDAVKGLLAVGYLSCEGGVPKRVEDLRKITFHVNSGYARDLKEAIDPGFSKPAKPRRLRRE
jgi:hypothetical protein